MDEETNTKAVNILLLIITGLLAGILLITILILNKTRNTNNYDSLPELEVIENRTSTSKVRTTRITTVTTEYIGSPYYTYDVSNILSNEAYITKNYKKADNYNEATLDYANLANQILNVNNTTLFDVNRLIKYARENENEYQIISGNTYAKIYNANELFKQIFTDEFIDSLTRLKYNGKYVFKKVGNEYYRLEPQGDDKIKISSISSNKISQGKGTFNVIINSQLYEMTWIFVDETKWKINTFALPGYEFDPAPTTESTTTITTQTTATVATTTQTTTTTEEATGNE